MVKFLVLFADYKRAFAKYDQQCKYYIADILE